MTDDFDMNKTTMEATNTNAASFAVSQKLSFLYLRWHPHFYRI